jgi:hypothetical protein
LSAPEDPVASVNDMCDVFFPKQVSTSKKMALKAILTNGLPDSAFTTQYMQYAGGDTSLESALRSRVNIVLSRILQMPEFHTI